MEAHLGAGKRAYESATRHFWNFGRLSPVLKIEIIKDDGAIVRATDQDLAKRQQHDAIYYHLKVKNINPRYVAKNCRVLVREIRRKATSNKFIPHPLPAALQMRWPFHNPAERVPLLSINREQEVDFISMKRDGVRVEAYHTPASTPFTLNKDESVKIYLEAVADNYTPEKLRIFQVTWNEKRQIAAEIEDEKRHLIIEEVNE
jgi:hypothetical protein